MSKDYYSFFSKKIKELQNYLEEEKKDLEKKQKWTEEVLSMNCMKGEEEHEKDFE